MPRPVPIGNQIAEVERELKVRERVYQRWMQTNKIKPEVAGMQMERMQAVRDTLLRVAAAEEAESMASSAPAAGG